MKRLLNLGVSNPLVMGMAHPVADRIETLGRTRPMTRRSRCLALSAMGSIAIATAPITMAETTVKTHVDLGNAITVIPDMSDANLSDLKFRMDKLSSGEADKEILTEFMMQEISKLVARYDADDELLDIKVSIPYSEAKEVLDAMPEWLRRCKSEKSSPESVMRTQFSWGLASVQCTVFPIKNSPTTRDKN